MFFHSGKERGTREFGVAFVIERSMILDFKAVDERGTREIGVAFVIERSMILDFKAVDERKQYFLR
jgi:hypothetical protein